MKSLPSSLNPQTSNLTTVPWCLALPVLLAAGCAAVHSEPVQSLGAQWCLQTPGGLGVGVVATVSHVVGDGADGLMLGGELALSGAAGEPAGALGVFASTGPDLFYLLAGRTTPLAFRYAAPWLAVGAGILAAGEFGGYAEARTELCIFLPETMRLRCGYSWGYSSSAGGYAGVRAGAEWLF